MKAICNPQSAIVFFLALSFTFFTTQCIGQSVFGKWKTIDDNSGEVQSIIKIEERDGKIYGKFVQVFPRKGHPVVTVCTKCSKSDPRYNKKIVGMDIMQDIQKNEKKAFWEGKILDPTNGKIYPFKMWLENGTLKVRGYWFFFYRTQVWIRP